MVDRWTRFHERGSGRALGGLGVSVLVHLAVIAGVLYATGEVRRSMRDPGPRSHVANESTGPVRLTGQQRPPGAPVDSTLPEAGSPAAMQLAAPDMTLPPELLRAARIPPVLARLPDTLELGRPEVIRFAVPRDRTPPDAEFVMVGARGERQTVRLSRARLAALYGDELVVEPASPPLQVSSPGRATEWHWTVTPTAPGLREVFLQLDAPAVVDGEERIVTIARVRQEVLVRETTLQRLSGFFATYWTVLVGMTLLALWSAARGRMRRE